MMGFLFKVADMVEPVEISEYDALTNDAGAVMLLFEEPGGTPDAPRVELAGDTLTLHRSPAQALRFSKLPPAIVAAVKKDRRLLVAEGRHGLPAAEWGEDELARNYIAELVG